MTADAYAHPVLDADPTDPDVVRVGAERERDAAHSRLAPAGRSRPRIEIAAGAGRRFAHDTGEGLRPSGPVFAATPRRRVGALLGLFALAPSGPGHAGAASFTEFRTRPL